MFYRATRLYQLYDFSAQSSETGSAACFFPVLLSALIAVGGAKHVPIYSSGCKILEK